MKTISRFFYMSLLMICMALMIQIISPSKAYAHGCQCASKIASEHNQTRNHFDDLLERHQNNFLIDTFWETIVEPSLQNMMREIKAVAAGNTQAIGTFMDSAQNLEAQRVGQIRGAQTVTDTIPSELECKIGSGSAGVAGAEIRSQTTTRAVLTTASKRAGNVEGTPGAQGPVEDVNRRFEEMCAYADPRENNGGLAITCGANAGSSGLVNGDVNVQNVLGKLTISGFSPDDQDNPVWQAMEALGNNLYGHNQASPVSADLMDEFAGKELYLAKRALDAKRRAAMLSFATIVGKRAEGDASTSQLTPYLLEYAGGLDNPIVGVAQAQIYGTRPSYMAQMGILSKVIATDPKTIVELIDTPANVERANATFNAINNWITFERLESSHRQEFLLSLILEMQVAEEEKGIQQRLNSELRSAGASGSGQIAQLSSSSR